MAGFLFILVTDNTMLKITDGTRRGIRWKFTTWLKELDFADDFVLSLVEEESTCKTKTA